MIHYMTVRASYSLNVIGKEGQDMFKTSTYWKLTVMISKVLQEFKPRCPLS